MGMEPKDALFQSSRPEEEDDDPDEVDETARFSR